MYKWSGARIASARRGTTLVELLVALGILALLVGIAMLQPSMWQTRERAERVRLQTEARALWLAQETYRAEIGTYYIGGLHDAAVRTAGFTYSSPADVILVVEHAGPAHWSGTLALRPGDAKGKPEHYCRLTLTGDDSSQAICMMENDRDMEGPDAGKGVAPPELDPARR